MFSWTFLCANNHSYQCYYYHHRHQATPVRPRSSEVQRLPRQASFSDGEWETVRDKAGSNNPSLCCSWFVAWTRQYYSCIIVEFSVSYSRKHKRPTYVRTYISIHLLTNSTLRSATFVRASSFYCSCSCSRWFRLCRWNLVICCRRAYNDCRVSVHIGLLFRIAQSANIEVMTVAPLLLATMHALMIMTKEAAIRSGREENGEWRLVFAQMYKFTLSYHIRDYKRMHRSRYTEDIQYVCIYRVHRSTFVCPRVVW